MDLIYNEVLVKFEPNFEYKYNNIANPNDICKGINLSYNVFMYSGN